MKSTKEKAVKSNIAVYANGRIWKPEAYKRYRQYQIDYTKKNYRTFAIRFSKEKDAKVIAILEKQDNCIQFLREAILAYEKAQRGSKSTAVKNRNLKNK